MTDERKRSAAGHVQLSASIINNRYRHRSEESRAQAAHAAATKTKQKNGRRRRADRYGSRAAAISTCSSQQAASSHSLAALRLRAH